ncbi:MAG: hypothetical protein ACYC9Y_11995 [Candidatus Methylomirabilia bacterium]
MRTFCIFMAVNILGALGWWLGSSFGIGTALALSTVFSLAGVWVGWQLFERFLS